MDFWEIYEQNYRPVRTFISRMTGDAWGAEDLTQETFIKVQANLDSLRDESKLRSWIFKIARNVCRDHFRRRPAREDDLDEVAALQVSIKPMAQTRLEQHEMSECIQDKMQMIPESLRDVLVLYDAMDMSQQEIADVLDITVGNVKVRLHRARKALKKVLDRECFFEHDERNVMVCLPKKTIDKES